MSDPASTIERRAATEWRAAGRRLEGYAATFGTSARIADFTEVIAPGAFKAGLARRDDVLALVDHDPRRLLGRTRSGTLKLSEDSRGLEFSVDVPDTQLGRDIVAMVERQDVGGMSFAFNVEPRGEAWEGRNRTLLSVKLVDVSVVQSFPAYDQTSVAARSAVRRLPLALAGRYLETLR